MSIKVENLTKLYGEQKAIDGISFDIPSGQIVGFLGPNGAGKSTTMKILTGYLNATSGMASVNGLEVEANGIAVRKQIGYLPENNPQYLDMYVLLNLLSKNKKIGIFPVHEDLIDVGDYQSYENANVNFFR